MVDVYEQAPESSTAVAVALSAEVPDGGRVVVDVEGKEIGIFRIDGELRAWENRCLHAGGPICQGKMIRRVIERLDDQKRSLGDDYAPSMNVVCPWHGYEYDIATGQHPGDPSVRLRGFRVTEVDGEILVHI